MTTPYPVFTDSLPMLSLAARDTLGTLAAVAAFALLLYTPGYVAAYAADLFGFRAMKFGERSIWAVACSFLLTPLASYFAARAAGLGAVCAFALGTAIATVVLLVKDRRQDIWPTAERRLAIAAGAAITLFMLLMLIDVTAGGRLYYSVVMADQSYRISFTDAVLRTGVPPANPLYFAGSPAVMRYYYFWYVLCATVVKLAHVSARQAFIASSAWAGFGLLATVQLLTTHFYRWGRKQRWIAVGLLTVMGADLLPALGNALGQPHMNGDIEWWSVDPLDAWPDSLLWVPHHVASALCCLLAFLFLWRTMEQGTRRTRVTALAFAAAGCASAFGLSVYVAFGFALMMFTWLVWLWWQKHPERVALLRRTALLTLVCAIVVLPFLLELTRSVAQPVSATGPATPPSHLFQLSVRPMIDSGLLTGLPVFTSLNAKHPVLLDQSIRLLLFIPGLAMELGIYAAALILILRARRRGDPVLADPARDTALFFTISGLILTCFISSSVISNNDFGYRAVMLPQMFLLLLTADLLGSWSTPGTLPLAPNSRGNRRIVFGLLWLGIAGTIYGSVLLRAWLPAVAAAPNSRFALAPDDAFQIRSATDELNRVAPKDAVVAFRPIDPEPDKDGAVMTANEYYQRELVMDTRRQLLNAEGKCAVQFGGDSAPCSFIQAATARLYAAPALPVGAARKFCASFGVSYLIVSHRDPNWATTTGWTVELPAVATQPGIRILACR